MAYAYVQEAHPGAVGGTADVYTIAITPSSGGFLTLVSRASSENRSILSISDSKGNSWTARGSQQLNGSRMEVWTASAVAAGATTITVTYDTTSVTTVTLLVTEHSGLGSFDIEGDDGTLGGVSSLALTTAAATTSANEMVLAVGYSESASRTISTVTTGYAERVHLTGVTNEIVVADKPVTAIGTQSATVTLGGGNGAIAVFIITAAESGGGGPPPSICRLIGA